MNTDRLLLGVFFAGALLNMGILGADILNWVCLLAAMAAFRLLQIGEMAPLRGYEKLALVLATLIVAVPIASLGRVAAGCCGLLFLLSQTDGRIRGAVVIFVSLILRDPIAKAALDITSETVLALDATLAESIMGLIGLEAVRQGNIITTNSHELLVMSGCSSVTNLSWALLLWITATRLAAPVTQTRHYLAAVTVVTAVIAVNGARLAFLGISPEFHAWAHGGEGTVLFETATLVAALIVITWSLRHDLKQYGLFSLGQRPDAGRRCLENG